MLTAGEAIPRELLVMGVLKTLGRGLVLEELETGSRVSKTAHGAFLHSFIKELVLRQYAEHIRAPSTVEEIRECVEPYRNVGFDGAIGSTDCTHIPVCMSTCLRSLHCLMVWRWCMSIQWDSVPFSLRNQHIGKEGYPTRVFEMTVNHNRLVLSVTAGFPGTVADITVARSDGFIDRLRTSPYTDIEYHLLNRAGTETLHRGVYLITDNGYTREPIFMFPQKFGDSEDEILFSKRLESVRKDVEATFGIIKVASAARSR
jgi:hypothetical protein